MLVLGWGSTYGAIASATEACQRDGKPVASIHLRHVWPLPEGLDAILGRYKAVLVPEMNMGQMARVLRSEYPQHNIISYPKVEGQPFLTSEIVAKVDDLLQSN